MRVWVEVFDTSNTKLGVAYDIISAEVTKALDAGGKINLAFPATAEDTVNLLAQERRIAIWVEQDEKRRLFGSGVIREINIDNSESQAVMTATGPDSLDDLTRKSVLLNRSYTSQTIDSVASSLTGLVAGWTVIADAGLPTLTASFDGSSVLKALVRMAEETGLHIREGLDRNTLEIGAFGTDNGVVALEPGSMLYELYNADSILLINNMSRKTDSKDVVNWIIPLGADDGAGHLLTLEDASNPALTLPGPDGSTLYYLQDEDSITSYGQIERVVTFKEITDADALHDAANAWLDRNAQPLVTYSISASKCRTEIRPGDKIRVIYKGIVETERGDFSYLDVNEVFWVMKVTETISDSGMNVTLDVTTVARYEIDTIEIVVGALESINVTVVSANKHIGYIKIVEQQTSGTASGTFTSGAWQTRGLNQIVVNENNHASLNTSNGQITLDAGTYKYRAMGAANQVDIHQMHFYNITDGDEMDVGLNAHASSTALVATAAHVHGEFTITEPKTFELQHRCTTTKATNGFGFATGWGTEVYSSIEFDKTA